MAGHAETANNSEVRQTGDHRSGEGSWAEQFAQKMAVVKSERLAREAQQRDAADLAGNVLPDTRLAQQRPDGHPGPAGKLVAANSAAPMQRAEQSLTNTDRAASGQSFVRLDQATVEALKAVDSKSTAEDLRLSAEQQAALPGRTTEEVIMDHLRLSQEGKLGADLVRNYSPHVSVVSNYGNFTGIEGFFRGPSDSGVNSPSRNFRVDELLTEGNTAYVKWSAKENGANINDGIDAFVIRDGQITAHTSFYAPEKTGVDANALTTLQSGDPPNAEKIAQSMRDARNSGSVALDEATVKALKVVDAHTTPEDLKISPAEREALARRSTAEVFFDHLRLRREGKLGADLVRNYDPDVVLVSNHGNFKGIGGIIQSATILGQKVPTRNYAFDGLLTQGNTTFEKWSASGNGVEVKNGIDAFIIRDGKITAQTIFYDPHPAATVEKLPTAKDSVPGQKGRGELTTVGTQAQASYRTEQPLNADHAADAPAVKLASDLKPTVVGAEQPPSPGSKWAADIVDKVQPVRSAAAIENIPGTVIIGYPDDINPLRVTMAHWGVRGVTALPINPERGDQIKNTKLGDAIGKGGGAIVRLANGEILTDPDVNKLAESLVHVHPNKAVYDVVVVGAGPAGLSSMLNGAFEGWNTLGVGGQTIGGQMSLTSGIKNLLGHEHGVSGPELTRMAMSQIAEVGRTVTDEQMRTLPLEEKAKLLAEQTGELLVNTTVKSLRTENGEHILTLSEGSEVRAKAVVFATGLTPKRLVGANGKPIEGIERYEGKAVFYGPGPDEHDLQMGDDLAKEAARQNIAGKDLTIIGDANSAAQAAVNLAQNGAHGVDLISNNSGLDKVFMSGELKKQIEEINAEARAKALEAAQQRGVNLDPKDVRELIKIHFQSAVESINAEQEAYHGVGRSPLSIKLTPLAADKKPVPGGIPKEIKADRMLIFIGSEPPGDFPQLATTVRGFIKTQHDLPPNYWPLSRKPLPNEVLPGIFAAGDAIEHDSRTAGGRIAQAIGEGSTTMKSMTAYLDLRDADLKEVAALTEKATNETGKAPPATDSVANTALQKPSTGLKKGHAGLDRGTAPEATATRVASAEEQSELIPAKAAEPPVKTAVVPHIPQFVVERPDFRKFDYASKPGGLGSLIPAELSSGDGALSTLHSFDGRSDVTTILKGLDSLNATVVERTSAADRARVADGRPGVKAIFNGLDSLNAKVVERSWAADRAWVADLIRSGNVKVGIGVAVGLVVGTGIGMLESHRS